MEVKYPKVAIGLLHYPMKDREKRLVATNVTNFDIHDIARAAIVYAVDSYFLIHPMKDQLMFVERVLDHWRSGDGAKYNPFRKKSLERTRTAPTLEDAVKQWGEDCLVLGTHAQPVPGAREYTVKETRKLLWQEQKPIFIVFGTDYGMTDDYMLKMDGVLESIKGAPPQDIRHLSVRSAVSIYLDRLLGSCYDTDSV